MGDERGREGGKRRTKEGAVRDERWGEGKKEEREKAQEVQEW